ncbi:hypothetical protein HS088_TW15G00906 [Tripterygium wilfordii]|uniref:S-protein homolog n=1 Tax=Tripterygium wilfordii TaxID=458696 RepID=A0A7J7CMV8_TRIWF|nr:hypothetical protein HS088_TW15G00906 [Tripterygium wilfordii]
MKSFTKHLILLLVSISISFCISVCDAFWPVKTHVHVNNRLDDPKENFNIHCLSGDDDLGEHQVTHQQDYHFAFTPNFIGTTLFHCTFSWPGQFHKFDIYKATRDGCTTCKWDIYSTGPYRSLACGIFFHLVVRFEVLRR